MKRIDINAIGERYFKTRQDKDLEEIYIYVSKLSRRLTYEHRLKDYKSICNSAIIKIIEHIDQFDSTRGQFYLWVYGIITNEILHIHRRNKHFSKDVKILEDTDYTYIYKLQGFKAFYITDAYDQGIEEFDTRPDYDVVSELHKKTIDCIYNLSDDKREGKIKRVLIKAIIEKRLYKDIAISMNLKENTVKNFVRVGKELLADKISKEYPQLVKHYTEYINI